MLIIRKKVQRVILKEVGTQDDVNNTKNSDIRVKDLNFKILPQFC